MCVGRQIRLALRLALKARLVLSHEGLIVVVVAVETVVAILLSARRLLRLLLLLIVVGILLAELFLRGGDQTKIMFGVLIVVFGGDGIAGALCVASELYIFFRDMRGGAADFHVGSIGLIDSCQRILTFAVAAVTPAPTHALLTISHDLPFR